MGCNAMGSQGWIQQRLNHTRTSKDLTLNAASDNTHLVAVPVLCSKVEIQFVCQEITRRIPLAIGQLLASEEPP